jgi:cytochrome c-type biogenesis protein CcmH
MRRRILPIGMLLLLAIALNADQTTRMENVAGKLSCYCGGCPHLPVLACGCSTADRIKVDIQKKLDSGLTEQQVLDDYVAQYGNTVLAAPPGSGFNLTAYVVPFLGFIVGSFFLYRYLKSQQRSVAGGQVLPEPPAALPDDDEYRRRLRRDLDSRR